MKILLVAMNAKYVHSNLAVYSLKAYANREEVKINEYTINHNLNDILMGIYREDADVVAFSCYIWNIKEVLTIAKELKAIAPKTRIWLGGPEVSYDAKDVLEKNSAIDLVMIGEGEKTFSELVDCVLDSPMTDGTMLDAMLTDERLSLIKGIAYRGKDILTTPVRPLMPMDEIPFVYKNLNDFKNKIIYYETSRGCPFSCSYCLSSIDKSVRFRSLSLVYEELQFFLDHGVKQVKFVDRTFNCKKEHAMGIWRYITEHDNGITNFHFEVSADLLDDEAIALFAKMRKGLIQLEIGLQSSNPETITAIKRRMNLGKLEENMQKVRCLKNIHQHLDLIAGLPNEDLEAFKNSFDYAFSIRPDQLQLGFLKVLKGSFMHEMRQEYGLVYHEDPVYEIMANKWISFDDIIALKQVEEVLEIYYNSGQFSFAIEYVLTYFDRAYDCFAALAKFYEEKHYFEGAHKRVERYEIFYEFAKAIVDKEYLPMVSDLLMHDLFLRENLKSRPSFAMKEDWLKEQHMAFFENGGDERIRTFYPEHKKLATQVMHLEAYQTDVDAFANLFEKRDFRKLDAGNDRSQLREQMEDCFGKEVWILYDYRERNPLNNAAKNVTV